MRVPYFFVWMAAVVASSAFGEDTYRVVEVKKGGRIAGVVKMTGDLPPAEMVEVTKDEAVCGSSHPLEDFVVDAKSKGVQNVVVAIVDIAAGKDFEQTSEVIISQEECLYVPHVKVYKPNTKLTVLNTDGLLHTIHGYSLEGESLFNTVQAAYVKKWPIRRLKETEVINVQCDVHEWMNAYLVPVVHPYFAVTDAGGAFEIDQVPPGTYALRAWHEMLGNTEKTVVVGAEATVTINFDLTLSAGEPSSAK